MPSTSLITARRRAPPRHKASRSHHGDHLAERQRLCGRIERGLESDPGLLERSIAGEPRGAAQSSSSPRRPSGSTRTASRTRRWFRRTAIRSTISIWRDRAPMSCSSTCSATTRATSRSIRPSRNISAHTSRAFSPCGARTIPSSCRPVLRHSSATFPTPWFSSSTAAILRSRRMLPTSRRRSAAAFVDLKPAQHVAARAAPSALRSRRL